MGKALIFTETKDRKNHADGREFLAQARALYEHWSPEYENNDLRLHRFKRDTFIEKQDRVLDAIDDASDVERIAFFCHGFTKWNRISLGFKLKDIPELAKEIAGACTSGTVHIGLFACVTGRGAFWWNSKNRNLANRKERIVTQREGFAMYLCSKLRDEGINSVITAHLTYGHTTWNPYKVRIQQEGEYITRTRMCESKPRGQWRAWISRLKESIPFRFNLMMGTGDED